MRMVPKVIVEDLDTLFFLDNNSPSGISWKVDRMRGGHKNTYAAKKGDFAGWLENTGYWRVSIGKKKTQCHRIAYELANKVKLTPYDIIDHIDGNKANNKADNLQITSKRGNCQNQKTKLSSSGLKCVRKTVVHGVEYWEAWWKDPESSISKVKRFNITKLGECEAKRLAIEYREQKVIELNTNGANYLKG